MLSEHTGVVYREHTGVVLSVDTGVVFRGCRGVLFREHTGVVLRHHTGGVFREHREVVFREHTGVVLANRTPRIIDFLGVRGRKLWTLKAMVGGNCFRGRPEIPNSTTEQNGNHHILAHSTLL